MALCCSYCYSEIVKGTTPNAAANPTWSMSSVLPSNAGLEVSGVIYKYTTIKQTQDAMFVDIQNKNAMGEGYIFRNRDDWSSLPGNTIVKTIPVANIPAQFWGDGSIEVEGKGSVVNPIVTYTYRYDTCSDPITDPRCPGYAAAMAAYLEKQGLLLIKSEGYDPNKDPNVQASMASKVDILEEEKKQLKKAEQEERDDRVKKAGVAAENAITKANGISQTSLIESMNNLPKFDSYYTSLPGGVYKEALKLPTTSIPENRRALRMGVAQQELHNKLINLQYKHRN